MKRQGLKALVGKEVNKEMYPASPAGEGGLIEKENASTHVGVDAVVKHSDPSFRDHEKMFAFESIKGWIDELRASALMEQGKTAEEILTINRRREKVMWTDISAPRTMQVGKPTKESQVKNSIARLLNSIESLSQLIDDVECRFSHVLRSEKKLAESRIEEARDWLITETSKDVEELVPLAMELNQIIPAINRANDRLCSIAARCEL